jgi:hypothetical protein
MVLSFMILQIYNYWNEIKDTHFLNNKKKILQMNLKWRNIVRRFYKA